MKNIYEKLYNINNLLILGKNHPRIKKMLSILSTIDIKNKKILDIGCHDGTFLTYLKKSSRQLYGIDANPSAINVCKKNNILAKKYFFDDKSPFPHPNSFFDLIVAGELIEHIYDTDFLLSEIHRLLKPSGKVLISTPNIASLGRRMLLLLGQSPLLEDSPNMSNSVGHIRYFTFKRLDQLLLQNKFKKIVMESDTINFNNRGSLRSKQLAELFPTFGQSIISLYQKN